MASTARQKQPAKRGGADPGRRAPAWTGARASPTFSPSNTPRPQPNQPLNNANSNASNFPSLGQANGSGGGRPDPARDRLLQSLAGLTGTTVTLSTKTGQRYEGVVGSTAPEGDMAGVTLKDVKEISTPGAPLKDSLFIASTNIDNWTSGPADSKPANGDSFRTDVEISGKKVPGRERELQAWVDSDATTNDADTFGDLNGSSKTWDQFAANEKLFGVKATFDENVYTTPLNRDAPDFKERERKATQIAKDIMGTVTNNPHVAEERGLVDDSGANEEDKYGAVVRGAGAYVPPGARRGGPPPGPATADKPEIPKVSVNGPDGTSVASANIPSPVPANATAAPAKQAPADAVPAFREFVSNEKQRLTQKRQALVKNEMDKRMAELVKFSQSFKLNKPIPDDLVAILAKDEEKQKAIREKAEKDAASAQARAIGASTPSIASRGVLAGAKPAGKPNTPMAPSKTVTGNLSQTSSSSAVPKAANGNTAASSSSAAATAAAKSNESVLASKKVSMVIQAIPPFRGSKPAKPAAPASAAQSASNGSTPMSPAVAAAAANRLNVNAPSFKVKPATPSASASPKPKPSEPVTPNPFFGSRPIKKTPLVNIKDDFNPFKHNKVVDASQITAMWPYNGKRYMSMYPTPQHPPVPHAPHMPPPIPSPMPPPSYEEDQAAATAQRGYVYAYPQYYPGQPMMPGMPPPPPNFMPGPYMQHMPYPPNMHHQNAMYSPGMGHMPPPGAYMPPPPGAYPPPNGVGPRPSMPSTPMPSHAHAHYYQQSPQMQHAVPYPMMMPPPPQQGVPPVPHPYDGQQPPAQVPMGGHA